MPFHHDVRGAMDDESFVDVVLVGTDNVEIPCTKFVLATRSPIFKDMFFGGGQQRDRVCLDYPSVILKVLAKFCYSDEVDLDLILDAESLTDQEAIALVQLRDAARYLELYDIATYIEKEIGESVFHRNETGCVCAILSELMHRIDDEGTFWDMFLQLVIHKPEECLLPTSEANQGLMACHPKFLARVLDTVEDKYIVVRCLVKWFEDACMEEESNKYLLVLSKKLDLKELSPPQLATIEPSPLFPMPRLYDALVHRCKEATTNSIKNTTSIVYVSGSGVKGLDGCYHPPFFARTQQVYQKEGVYGEVPCHFEVKWSPADTKWTICVIPKTNGSVPLTMYEAPPNNISPLRLPFMFWKCIDGAEPAPLVAMIDSTITRPSLFTNCPGPDGQVTGEENALSFGTPSAQTPLRNGSQSANPFTLQFGSNTAQNGSQNHNNGVNSPSLQPPSAQFAAGSRNSLQATRSNTSAQQAFAVPTASTNKMPAAKSTRNEEECSICLCKYKEKDNVVSLPCGHEYHRDCIASWRSNHQRCPLCNLDLRSVPFAVTTKQDGSTPMNLQSISAMAQYEQKSFEEIRLEDYNQGNMGSANSNMTGNSGDTSQQRRGRHSSASPSTTTTTTHHHSSYQATYSRQRRTFVMNQSTRQTLVANPHARVQNQPPMRRVVRGRRP